MERQEQEWVAWPVAWSAIWVGALTALAVGLLVGLIGFALGYNEMSGYVDWKKVHLIGLVFAISTIIFRFIKFCRIVVFVAILFGVHVSLGFGRQRKTVSFLPSPLGRAPLTVLISTADATISEIDYWIHGFLSRLGRPIDVQVVETENLKLVDNSIIISLNDLTKWANITTQSGFRNVGLLRVGE